MKKNLTKLAIMVGIVWIWLPSGPSALVIQPFLIDLLGMELYIISSIVLVMILYNMVEGRTLSEKFNTVMRESKQVWRSLY